MTIKAESYAVIIRKLSESEGGGYIGIVPDLTGCMSDGETQIEALTNTQMAILEWLDENAERGMEAPPPGWRSKNSRQEREELLQRIEALSSDINNIDVRIEEIERSLLDLREYFDNEEAWARAARIISAVELSPEFPFPSKENNSNH